MVVPVTMFVTKVVNVNASLCDSLFVCYTPSGIEDQTRLELLTPYFNVPNAYDSCLLSTSM